MSATTTDIGPILPPGNAILHKSPAGGVPPAEWHIAEVRCGMERACRDKLQRTGFESYVASRVETRVYASRNRRRVERVVIPAKVFVRLTEAEHIVAHEACAPALYKFMTDRARQPRDAEPLSSAADRFRRAGHPFAVVPEEQMQRLRFMLGQAERPVEFVTRPLSLGDRVRVIRGPLAGLEGGFVRQGRATYIAVLLDALGCTLTEIPETDIEPLG